MIKDDGDIVRGLGFVTLYASYLEEQIEELIDFLKMFKKYKGGWQISGKINHAIDTLTEFNQNRFSNLILDLRTCLQIFEERNAFVHGRIYAGIKRPDTLKSSRPNVPDREVESAELYQLANAMNDFRSAIYRPMIFELPKALREYQDSRLK
ncbi:hypothetical protein BMS3Bbin08_00204 [bacterium BMS3Bbin08]|nr:hypothetical protein BMS3Bbin08_00204 [bacterium BMS3Bbin08]